MLLAAMVGSLLPVAQAEADVKDLVGSMVEGEAELVSIAGSGKSTGTVLTGYLINRSSVSRNFDINLGQPLFLDNSGQGQDMVVTQIYGENGSYYSDGEGNSFLTAGPGARTPIVLFAFCADFEKDNPTSDDRFAIQAIPSRVGEVSFGISAYQKANPKADIAVAGQLALWVSQGYSLEKIRERFSFTETDVETMNRIFR